MKTNLIDIRKIKPDLKRNWKNFRIYNLKRLSGSAIYTFIKISELWNLSFEEQKNLLALPQLKNLQDIEALRYEVLPEQSFLRVSHLIGIYKEIQIRFQTWNQCNEKPADEYIKMPNKDRLFKKKSPLEYIMENTENTKNLEKLRKYLKGLNSEELMGT